MTDPATPVLVFDVNETLSDLTPLAERFADLGQPEGLARTWFASVLRDGFALAVTGRKERFATLADSVLRTVLHGEELDRDLDAAVEHVMSGFTSLPVHPDVPDGVRALRAAGLRLVTLSNGARSVAESLLDRAGVADAFEALLTVEDAPRWKPAREAYEHAAQACGVDVGQLVLVAVHPWDTDGAMQAGLQAAYLSRDGTPYPAHLPPPTYVVRDLVDLAGQLGPA